jgi:hypothetical protein
MTEEDRLKFALALIKGRLHKAVGEKRCGCGQCAHWVTVAAKHAGVRRAHLVAALPPAAKPQRASRRARQPWRVRICDSTTIRIRGRDVDEGEGLAILISRLHDPG